MLFIMRANGAAAERRAEGPSVLAACSAGAGGRIRGVLRRGPVQPGACARLNARHNPEWPVRVTIGFMPLLGYSLPILNRLITK